MIKNINFINFLKGDVLGVIFLKSVNIFTKIILSVLLVRLFGLEFKGLFFEITSIAGIASFIISLSYQDFILFLQNKNSKQKSINLFYPIISLLIISISYFTTIYLFRNVNIYIGFLFVFLSEFYIFSILKAKRKYNDISVFFLIKNFTFIILLILISDFNFNYNYIFNVILLVQLILVLTFWTYNLFKIKFQINIYIKDLFDYSKYVHVNNIFNDIENKVDILIIIFFLSSTDLGLYSIILVFAQAIFHFVNIINQIFSPILSKLSSDDKLSLVTLTSFVSLLSTIFLYLSGKFMLEFFYLINENNAYYYLIILSTGVYFESITKVLVNHIKLSNKFKSVGKIAFVTAIINIFLNLLLIPLIGIYGAVITSFLTYFIRFLWFYLTYIDVFNISSSFFAWSPKRLIYIFNMIKNEK